MSHSTPIIPSRRVLNPILLDTPLIDVEGPRMTLFYAPLSQALERSLPLISAGIAAVALAGAFVSERLSAPVSLKNLLILVSFVIAGIPALQSVWESLSEWRVDIDALMLIGAGLAAVIGSPMEGALLLVLFAISGGLESFAVRRTQSAIVALRKLVPSEAVVIGGDGRTRKVGIKQVAVGATILVRSGERVPLDGEVVSGASAVDESAITGESMPRDKGVGDLVFAGTLNTEGRLEVRVTRQASDTTLAKVVKLVTQARQNRAPAQRLIDRIGPTYTVAVIIAAVAVGVVLPLVFESIGWEQGIRRGIALLIVASPCALMIATPVAYLSAIAAAARRGLLIKGGVFLEVLAKASVYLFDKTGTLTEGKVRLVSVTPPAGLDEVETLRLVAAVEASSTHPLAVSVMAAVVERGLEPYRVQQFESSAGSGLSGVVNGQSVWVGKPELLADRGVDMDPAVIERSIAEHRMRGETVSAVVVDRQVGLLAFRDELRAGAARCIARLRAQGARRIEMLTGDHALVARAIAGQLTLDGVRAELLPQDKLDAGRQLGSGRNGSLIMVGDGVNDAPLLAHADVGIAIGSIGADAALDAADIVLMNDRIEEIGWLDLLAKRTATIVRQNLVLAIGVIVVLSVLAVGGRVPLPLAVVGHEGSTVLVALNALRLLRTGE
ncbi:MAG: cation-translocating P-type ATPase [Planctomycetota bacterium]